MRYNSVIFFLLLILLSVFTASLSFADCASDCADNFANCDNQCFSTDDLCHAKCQEIRSQCEDRCKATTAPTSTPSQPSEGQQDQKHE